MFTRPQITHIIHFEKILSLFRLIKQTLIFNTRENIH